MKLSSVFGSAPVQMQKIEASEAVFQAYIQSDFYRDLASNPNYADYKNKRFEEGISKWEEPSTERVDVLPLAQQIVGDVFRQHVPVDAQIAEVGSNELNTQIGMTWNREYLSHFANLLPQEYRKNLIYSDYIRPIVERWSRLLQWNVAENGAQERKYRCLDLRDPNQNLEDGPQDLIAANNVADVMKREDLPLFAQGAHRNLKENGKVILLADRSLHMPPLFAKYSDENDFAFLWCEDKPKIGYAKSGVKIVKKQDLQPLIDRLDIRLKAHFQKIMNLKPAQRHQYFIASLINGLHDWDFLDQITQNIPHRRVEKVESYEQDVINAFASNGFKLIECGFKEKISTTDRGSKFGREVTFDPRGAGSYFTDTGKQVVKAGFHVMVFQKL